MLSPFVSVTLQGFKTETPAVSNALYKWQGGYTALLVVLRHINLSGCQLSYRQAKE